MELKFDKVRGYYRGHIERHNKNYFSDKKVLNEFRCINISLESENKALTARDFNDEFIRCRRTSFKFNEIVHTLRRSPVYYENKEKKVWRIHPEIYSRLEEIVKKRRLNLPVPPTVLCYILSDIECP